MPVSLQQVRLSQRVARLEASPIREILAVIGRPGMISFAGGLPAGDSFELPDFSELPPELLQYGPSEGEPPLREQIGAELRSMGLDCSAAQVLVLSGSQQGIDLAAKLLIDPGTIVALENPSYLAALQVFRFFGARFAGFDPGLPAWSTAEGERPQLCYAIPTFQNPGGHCYTLQQREALAAACLRSGTILFEDDPYRDLYYDDCERRPVCSLMQEGSWIYQGSFSKSYAPGLRLGFLACSEDLLTPLTRLKQAADLHSNRLSQYWILRQLQAPGRNARLEELRNRYRRKRDAFDAALQRHLGALADWDKPAGGLFFWLRLKTPVDTAQLLQQAIASNLAFMPGEAFFHTPPDPASGFLRLNFSHAGEQQMEQGLAVLEGLLNAELRRCRTVRNVPASV